MKEICVRIIQDSDKELTWEGGFAFLQPEMAAPFFAVVGNGEDARFNSKYVAAYTHWKAWGTIRAAGWINDGLRDGFIHWCKPETDAEDLELSLKHHDWTYMYSDDHRVWLAGEAARDHINELMKKVGDPLAHQLYERYSPKE